MDRAQYCALLLTGMDTWVIWVVVAVALLIVEATTSAFVAIYFGLAAIAAAAVAAVGLGLPIQLRRLRGDLGRRA